MKKNLFSLISVTLLTLLLLTGCKKDDDDTVETSPVLQNDQAGTTEANDALDDVNSFISNKVGSGFMNLRTTTNYELPCGVVSIDSVALGTSPETYRYTIQYGNQTLCGYKYKSGKLVFALTNGTKFSDAGAKFYITFEEYKVEVKANGSEITLNGTMIVTNVNGHYIWETGVNNQTVTHKLRGTLAITYDNGEERTRSYFQQRVWASSDGWAGLSLTVSGDTTIGAYTAVSDTGTTYEGNYNFKTNLSAPFKWINCGTDWAWAGPYVLKQGNAILNVTIPSVPTATIEVEAGYYWNYTMTNSIPVIPADACTANAYKIVTTIDAGTGPGVTTEYQLY